MLYEFHTKPWVSTKYRTYNVVGVENEMVEIDSIQNRVDHAKSIIETAEDHCNDPAERQALLKSLGMLEQVAIDLEQLSE